MILWENCPPQKRKVHKGLITSWQNGEQWLCFLLLGRYWFISNLTMHNFFWKMFQSVVPLAQHFEVTIIFLMKESYVKPRNEVFRMKVHSLCTAIGLFWFEMRTKGFWQIRMVWNACFEKPSFATVTVVSVTYCTRDQVFFHWCK